MVVREVDAKEAEVDATYSIMARIPPRNKNKKTVPLRKITLRLLFARKSRRRERWDGAALQDDVDISFSMK